ncbi:MAG TPA: sigma-54 dependent transcriptional regulator [Thermodesulfobacteriota bacterium]|nr:sigma-54 dependent transcriptional regulator [Thermodesulfobacteriota bacterium]
MQKFKILVVDDDEELVYAVKELLERRKYEVVTAFSGNEAIEKASSNPDISVALLDLVMPMMDGFTLLERLKGIHPDLNIIIITGHGAVPTAVEAIKRGAVDFITKPYDKDVLLRKLEMITKTHELESRLSQLKELVSEKYGFDQIVSGSQLMKRVFERASAAARTDAPVFIVGETGTGKELLAKAIHLKSERKDQPFVPVNCGAIPRELIESELFGYKKGAFTGAAKDYEGLFVAANRGTIFLDEVGEMPKELQVRLLRVLEESKVRPVGHTSEIPVNARVIAASNYSIEDLKNTYLREDLFFRLAVIVLELPPLRDRKEDIPLLVEHFIRKFNQKYSRNIKGVSEGALTSFYQYHFPGNIRELENLIEAIVAVSPSDKGSITDKDLKTHFIWKDTKTSEHTLLSLEKLEKFALEQAIRESQGNKSKAAEILGISRDTLYRKLKQFGIE